MERSSGSIQELLPSLPLYASLTAKTLVRLARGARQIEVAKGAVLFDAGEPSTGVYTVVNGLVKIAVPTAAEQDKDKVVALLGSGRNFGLSAIFVDEPHVVSAAAVRETMLVHVRKAQVLAAMNTDPAFAREIAASLSRRLRELLSEVRSSVAESGTQRTVTFLLSELPPSVDQGPATVTLPAKKRIIASRLALTGEHFSRILHELTSARLICVQGPKVTIEDVSKLRKYAYGERSCHPQGR